MKFAGIACILLVLSSSSVVFGQEPLPGIRKSMERAAAAQFDPAHQPLFASRAQVGPPPSSGARKAQAGLLGAFVGLVAGGYVGGKLDQNCGCNDPGINGALIGAPIGALLGAIAGVLLASR
jgi:hypothetical protein